MHCKFPRQGAWNLLAVGTAKGMEFWPKRSLIAGFINIYKFVDDGKSLKLLDKTK
jgi:splicing factor 3B subunit 3